MHIDLRWLWRLIIPHLLHRCKCASDLRRCAIGFHLVDGNVQKRVQCMRLAKLGYDELSPEQKVVWDEVVAGTRQSEFKPRLAARAFVHAM